jgi:two-component sensor histidine kinase
VVRDGQLALLPIRLAPIPWSAILKRWWSQLIVSLATLIIGTFVFWKRPQEMAARALMLFCVTLAVQLWCDGYNFQFAVLPWRWAFGFHLLVEHLTFSLSYASICHFALLFPAPHPLVRRFPRGLPLVLYIANPLTITTVMLLSPAPSSALFNGNQASLVVMLLQLGLGIVAGVRSLFTACDPVGRAQIRWIMWGVSIGFAVAIPGYFLPLILVGYPLIPNPVIMLLTIIAPVVYAIALLRYHLFEIELIINRTLVYGTLTALVIGLYLLLVRLLTALIEILLPGQPDIVAISLAALVIALAFDPLRRRVQAVIDRTFYRTKLDYQRLLTEMSARVASSIVPEHLANLLAEELPQRLQITWASLAVPDGQVGAFVQAGQGVRPPALALDHTLPASLHRLGQPVRRLQPPPDLPAEALAYLDRHQIELIIPLIVGRDLVGLYHLGPQTSGDGYSRDQVHILHVLAQQAAIALEHTRLHEKAQGEIRERQRLLDEKELLLKEIHHRVKNNLQVISSLLYLQSTRIRDQEALNMFVESQNRVRSMALVHERLYQTRDLARIDAADYVRTLAGQLMSSYRVRPGQVGLRVEVVDLTLDVNVAIPCGLILNELLSNALKYAFPNDRQGEIQVELRTVEAGWLRLVVRDDGVGFPPDLDFRQSRSLGLRLVNTLVEQLEGTIQLDRSGGTRFEVRFPQAV